MIIFINFLLTFFYYFRLDYLGISLLITGSFVPWLYYGFYCYIIPRIIYISLIIALAVTSVIVSVFDYFSEPRFRPLRAGVFLVFGLSGIIPGIHFMIWSGIGPKESIKSIFVCYTFLIIMALLYAGGALLYAFRIPERFFPGKCDYWVC